LTVDLKGYISQQAPETADEQQQCQERWLGG
jgi:hypothetical protein